LSDGAFHALQLTRDKIIGHTPAAHSVALNLQLIFQVSFGGVRVETRRMVSLLPDEGLPARDWERDNDGCGHD
jgi:hypothetical protein